MGVTQHHDSVSGTSKQHVAYDYAKQIAQGRLDADAGNAQNLGTLTGFTAGTFSTCDLANATICPSLETPVVGNAVLVLIWNHQGSVQSVNVRLPVGVVSGVNSYSITGADGSSIPSQLIQSTPADVSLRVDYYGASNVPIQWLVFQAPNVPAAGYSAIIITPSSSNIDPEFASVTRKMKVKSGLRSSADQTITNGVLTLTICADTGMLCNYADSSSSVTSPLTQSFFYYNSSIGIDAPKDGTNDYTQPSGAYIFRTNSSTNFPLTTSTPTVTIVSGPIVSEAQIVVAGYVTEVIRLWKGAVTVDIEITVGPIPNGPAPTGKEIVTRYATGMKTQGVWKTDSNVRDMVVRTRDYRPTWNYTVYEPIAGNYYPVNARITTTDGQNSLSVVTDRSQGGSSMVDGSVELMVQRRLQMDDRRGVGEPINEPGLNAAGSGLIVRMTHRLSISTNAAAPAVGKQAVQDMMFKPHLTFSALNVSASQWLSSYKPSFTGLSAPLPANVHLLTTHALSFTDVLVRLAHLFETGEDNTLSSAVTVSLTNLFKQVTLSNCVEMTVPGSKILANVPVRTVKIEGEGSSTFPTLPSPPNGADQSITINAMDVRTFMCNYAPL
jgi:lysosomal alpha-mannosidase